MDPEFARAAFTVSKYVTYVGWGIASTVVAYRALTNGKVSSGTIVKTIVYPIGWGIGALFTSAIGYAAATDPKFMETAAKGSVEFAKRCDTEIINMRLARGEKVHII